MQRENEIMSKKWQHRFMKIAKVISEFSKDPSTKVGAVIVSPNRQILATGYNGFPSRIEDKDEWYEDRSIKYPLIIHAEMNAVLNAAKNGVCIKDAWIFVTTLHICHDCAKHLAAAGIGTVVMEDVPVKESWQASAAQAVDTFTKAKIPIIKL